MNSQQLELLTGWQWFIWNTWGQRVYARNSRADFLFDSYLFCILQLCVMGFYWLWPFKIVGAAVVFGVSLYTAYFCIEQANQYKGHQLLFLILSALGLWFQLTWGFELMGYHLEPYVYILFLLGASMGLVRRAWNFWIWKLLDNIQGRNEDEDKRH